MQAVLAQFRALAGSFHVKLLIVLLLVIPVSALFGDMLYRPLTSPALDRQAERISDEFEDADLPPDELLHTMDKFGMAWLYVTDLAGHVKPKYKQAAPALNKIGLESGEVSWHGHHFYEVVAKQPTRLIHAGYRMEPLADLLHGLTVPFDYALFIIGCSAAATFACFHQLVSKPLKRIPSRLNKALEGSKTESGEMNGVMVASQITLLDADILTRAITTRDKLTSEIAAAKNDIREVISRERQQKFNNSVVSELHDCDSSDEMFQTALHKVQDRFSVQIPLGLGYALKDGVFELRGQFGLTMEQARPIDKLTKVDAFVRPLETGLCSIVPAIPEIELRVAPGVRTLICIAPIMHKQQAHGVLVFYIAGDEFTAQTIQPVLKDVAESTSKVVPTMLALEAEMEANRSDEMTGVTKIKYLDHYLEKLRNVLKQDERVSALLIEGDEFIKLNAQYGKQTGNDLIKELCRLVVSGVAPSDIGGALQMQTHAFRSGAAGFFVLLRVCDSKKASLVAERIRKFIEQYNAWPGGVPGWTVSVAHATMPENVNDMSLLLAECELTRDYLRQSNKKNATIASSLVPKQFRQKHAGNELGGTLNVFQPAALLQSLATARRSGLMEVTSKTGQKITIYVEHGQPKKARLKRLSGDDSIVEFVSTFAEGDFNFREFRSDLGSESLAGELTGLGSSQYDVSKPLESLLLDGALAQDHIEAARRSIPQLGLFLIRELKSNQPEAWEEVKAMDEPPSPSEFGAMQDIVKLGQGSATLQEIMTKKMEHVPTHVSMRAAQLLYEHKLIKLSPVKMLATF